MTLEVASQVPAAQLHLELVSDRPGEGGVSQQLCHTPATEAGRHHGGGQVHRVLRITMYIVYNEYI